mmetsp:Transcript_81665/g.249458  ORF Transcript_81665/g.249458 Transcript_81665/m.249458 type:complete len:352 (-) Transcript_81665:202-1257(-)
MLQGQADAVLVHVPGPAQRRRGLVALLPGRAEHRRGPGALGALVVAVARRRALALCVDAVRRGAQLLLDAESAGRWPRAAVALADLGFAFLPTRAELLRRAVLVLGAPPHLGALPVHGVVGGHAELPRRASPGLPRRAQAARPRVPVLLGRQPLPEGLALLARHAVFGRVALGMLRAAVRLRARAADAVVGDLAILQTLADSAAFAGTRSTSPRRLVRRWQRHSEFLAACATLAVKLVPAVGVLRAAVRHRAPAIDRVAAQAAPRDVQAKAASLGRAWMANAGLAMLGRAHVAPEAVVVRVAVGVRRAAWHRLGALAAEGVVGHLAEGGRLAIPLVARARVASPRLLLRSG